MVLERIKCTTTMPMGELCLKHRLRPGYRLIPSSNRPAVTSVLESLARAEEALKANGDNPLLHAQHRPFPSRVGFVRLVAIRNMHVTTSVR